MTRINEIRTIARNLSNNTSALVFAAVLIVCSITVGCSSDKPKTVTAASQIPVAQPESAVSPLPVLSTPAPQTEKKAVQRKVVHKKPATMNYADKTYGVTFEYPRRYAIETGEAATDLLASNPLAMNFVQPGGVALAAVELPETSFANTDFSSASFNVSVHKTLTADQCTEFAVPQPKLATPASSSGSALTPAATEVATQSSVQDAPQSAAAPASDSKLDTGSKLMLGDLELRSTEAVTGEGTRQSDSKYFHAFQNGACFEFALNVNTVASEEGVMKHVDRDKVFDRLEKILATVKINPIAAPEVTAEAPAQTPAAIAPAQ